MNGYIQGQDACAGGTPPRRYARGRVCVEEDCETVLSVYNRSAYCWQHDPKVFVNRAPRKRVFVLART